MTPGDIMRQTQATLRHRGFDTDELASVRVGDQIAVSGKAVGEDGTWRTMVALFDERVGQVAVTISSIDLSYTFEAEAS